MSRILVVDDSRTQATHLARLLQEVGHEVDVLHDSTQVLDRLREESYDLLLSDIIMPELNGYDLCRAVKREPGLDSIPVILLTSLRSTSDILEGLAAGADNFVTKPYNPETLCKRVGDALASGDGRRSADSVDFVFQQKRFRIDASRQQMLTFLMSTFEDFTYSKSRQREASQAAAMRLEQKTRQLEQANREAAEHKRRGDELSLEKERAESANMAKNRFVATMSHELRTSLNGIIGLAQLLAAGNTDPKHREYLDLLLTSSQNMIRLVNDVLDLSKIEADRLEQENIVFDIHQLLEEMWLAFEHRADAKGVKFEISLSDDVPRQVRGERLHLRHVLMNLCSNALKFTDSGNITLRCTRVESQTSDCVLRFEVEDTGIGIPADRLRDIFEPFTQADVSATREFGGTGLGLTIARRLVEFMGGTLSVESRIGEGSRFHFQVGFPEAGELGPAHPPRLAQGSGPVSMETRPCPEPTVRPAKLLLVDDNTINRRVGKSLVERLGYTCDVARNGREAITAFSKGGYDLVLMDCLMPEMDGYDATSLIRSMEPPHRHTPIIALTAALMDDERQRCLDAGMDTVVGKPLDLDTLERVLSAYLRVSP